MRRRTSSCDTSDLYGFENRIFVNRRSDLCDCQISVGVFRFELSALISLSDYYCLRTDQAKSQ